MPANTVGDVCSKAALCVFIGLLLFIAAHIGQDEALHRQRLSMLRKLLENDIRLLNGLLIVFLLVKPL